MLAPTRENAVVQAAIALIVALTVNALALGGGPAESPPDADLRSYLAGNGLLSRGMHEQAIAEYRTFLSRHADHDKANVARYGLCVCLFRLERFDEAAAELAPLRKLSDFQYAAETGVMEAQCFLARDRYAEAAAAFDGVLRRYADHDSADDAAAGAAEALYRDGKYEEAATKCRELASRWPDSPHRERAEFFWAAADMGRGAYPEAAERFSALLKTNPKSPLADEASLLLAQCYQRSDAPDKAIRQYRAALKKTPEANAPDVLLGLGSLLYQTGKYDEAGQALDELLEKHPKSARVPQAILQRAHVWFAQGEYERASDAFRKAGEANGDAVAETAYWMAKCELRQGKFPPAAKRLGEAIGRFPKCDLIAEMHYDRAIALLRSGEADEAAKALEQFTSRFADHALAPDALQLLAVTEHQQRHYTKSRGHAMAFLERYPKNANVSAVAFLAAENDFLAERFLEAAQSYRDFLAKFGGDAQADKARLRLGTALYRLERFDEAAAELESLPAPVKDELLRPALLTLGDIYFRRGEWKKAEEHLAAYLAGGGDIPSADDALMKAAYSRQRMDKNEDALRDYERLVQRFPQSPHRMQAIFERGQILVALKRTDEAKQAFERVLAEGGDSRFAPPALNHLAAMALQRNDAAEAARLYELAAGSAGGGDSEIETVFRQGQALMAGARYAEAEVPLRRVVERAEKSEVRREARARLAIAVARQERFADALTIIGEAERESGEIAALEPSLRATLRYEKAWCLRSLDRNDEAARAYRELLSDAEAGSARPQTMLELAELESSAKRYDAAVEVLRELKKTLDQAADAPGEIREQCLYRLGVCEFERGRFDEAAEAFEQLMAGHAKSPLLGSACYYAGEAHFQGRRIEKAVGHFARSAKDFPGDAAAGPALLRLGEAQAALQRWSASEQAYEDYLSRFPEGEQGFAAQFGVGWARENQKRYDDAIAAYERVVERHQGPTAARAQFQIGQCLFAEKKYEPAVRELLKVDILYAYPEWSAAALFEAGRCFAQLGDPAGARKQFASVTEKFKDTKWAEMAAKQLSELSATATLPGR